MARLATVTSSVSTLVIAVLIETNIVKEYFSSNKIDQIGYLLSLREGFKKTLQTWAFGST